jgi:hypothetical protein
VTLFVCRGREKGSQRDVARGIGRSEAWHRPIGRAASANRSRGIGQSVARHRRAIASRRVDERRLRRSACGGADPARVSHPAAGEHGQLNHERSLLRCMETSSRCGGRLATGGRRKGKRRFPAPRSRDFTPADLVPMHRPHPARRAALLLVGGVSPTHRGRARSARRSPVSRTFWSRSGPAGRLR